MKIRVGLITDGTPRLEAAGGLTCVHNLLIGDGFHWQRRVSAKFAGEISMLQKPQGNIWCINTLDIEDYVASVVGSEMNPKAPAEFLKAHAVISRSWAADKCLSHSAHTGFDVCSDDHCQRYQGVQDNGTAADAARATHGLILTDNLGNVADTRFSKCCGGRTELFSTCWEDTDFEYLPSQPDPWCDLSAMDDARRDAFLANSLKDYDIATEFMNWEATVDGKETARRLRNNFNIDLGNIIHIKALKRGPSGRICLLELAGTRGTHRIGKTLAIRRLLAADCLKSSWFDIEEEGDGIFRLRGHGWGHGVGLCQIGAAHMAAEGFDFRQILSFYYPGTKLDNIYERE